MKEQGRSYEQKMQLWKYVGTVMVVIILVLLIIYLIK